MGGGYLLSLLGGLSLIPGWMIMYVIRFPVFCIGIITAAGLVQPSIINRFIGYIAILIAFSYKFVGMMGWFSIDDDFTYIILSFGIVVLCLIIIRVTSIPDKVYSLKIIKVIKDNIYYIGKHSLEIYLLHEFVYRYTYRFLIDTPIPLFFQMLIGIGMSIFLAKILGEISAGLMKVVAKN